MTAIERTAYPRLKDKIQPQELQGLYTPTDEEIQFISSKLRLGPERTDQPISSYEQHRLNAIVLLKCFQCLGYFPTLKDIPQTIRDHIAHHLGIVHPIKLHYQHPAIRSRHRAWILTYLNVKPYAAGGQTIAMQTATEAARMHNYPADILNAVLAGLLSQRYELPPFKRLDRLVRSIRHRVNGTIFSQVHQKLPDPLKQQLNTLLTPATRTEYDKLKELPKSTTITHFKELLEHHDWLLSFGSFTEYLQDISQTKFAHFAGEAKSLDASDLRDMVQEKRLTLIVCLIHERQRSTKDDLVTMLIKTMAKIDKKAKTKLAELREQHTAKTHTLLTLLNDLVTSLGKKTTPKRIKQVRQRLHDYGGREAVLSDCEQAVAYHSDNHLPLIWQYFRSSRQAIFALLGTLDIRSSTQDDLLMKAKDFLLQHAHTKKTFLPADIDMRFAPKQWQKLILEKRGKTLWLVRRYFEACVFSCLTNELKASDFYVVGSDSYADFRNDLLPWQECESLIEEYCKHSDLAKSGVEAVQQLRQKLADKAKQIDARYPEIVELVIDVKGNPVLKKRHRKQLYPNRKLELAIKNRMPQRKLLDVLVNAHHYTGWADVFGPLSGTEPKIGDAVERYILTTFAYGTGMGPTQAAQHIRTASAHMLSWANRRHITSAVQDKAMTKLINYYRRFDLPKLWGTGKSAAADGTLRKIYPENLLAEYHVRYGSVGGIAYHHVADNYIALCSTFIPCGVWEAISIIEGLLKNQSEIQPKIVHSDTQGQSTVVFAMAYLLGITLMPRIRNWKDLKFYRPHKDAHYQYINALFQDTINWRLIEVHWQDMLQLVLSIKAGKVSSRALLRKFGSYSRKNKLCQAFRELGCVIRTLFLLDYISDIDLREDITVQTNKVEAYNGFTAWLAFGNPYTIVASNDPEEHEKAVKYNDLIANAVMLQNVIDISGILLQLIAEGCPVTNTDLSGLSPYMTEHLLRFGEYIVDHNAKPHDVSHIMKLPIFG